MSKDPKQPTIGSKCRKCKFLYTSYKGKPGCYYDEKKSKNLTRKTCVNFKAGFPFTPRVDGKLAKQIAFDPTKPCSFVFYETPEKMLLLSWHLDHNKNGYWKIRVIGIEPKGGIAAKQFSKDDLRPSFYGTVRILGAANSDLFTSANYDDPDYLDEEANIVNKPSEVVITSTKERKK